MRALRNQVRRSKLVGVLSPRKALCLAVGLLVLPGCLLALAASPETPAELVAALQVAVATESTAEIEELTRALVATGDLALPAIEEGMAKGEKRLTEHLVGVLGGIPGDGATSLLVSALPTDPSAIGMLENREVRRPLSTVEFGVLHSAIETAGASSAGSAARVLAKCVQDPARTRVAAILPRFLKEVSSAAPAEPAPFAYLSPRVLVLNDFLLAFSCVGLPAAADLVAERGKAIDVEARKWLSLALGMTGDPTVPAELEQLVRDEPDRYARWAAVRAYARSAGHEAIPLLRSLLDDETVSEYRGCVNVGQPFYLLREAARAELIRLEADGASR